MIFTLCGKDFESTHVFAEAIEVDRVSDTVIKGGGGGGNIRTLAGNTAGYIKPIDIKSDSIRYKMIWLKLNNRSEVELRLDDDFSVRAGYILKLNYLENIPVSPVENKMKKLVLITNTNTGPNKAIIHIDGLQHIFGANYDTKFSFKPLLRSKKCGYLFLFFH